MSLILASASPRRRELLATLGLAFRVCSGAELDEARVLSGMQGGLAERLEQLALLKGCGVAQAAPADTVLSADTAVVVDGGVLGKPVDAAEAAVMLTRLSGRAHLVLSAVAVQRAADGLLRTGCEATTVHFNALDDGQIARYVAQAQPFDYAGAYAIQGLGALLVRGIEGDYSNVVGLPLGLTARLLGAAGIEVL